MTTPYEAAQHLRESLISYLETAYKLSHPDLAAERHALLEQPAAVAQIPFLESTPAFPDGRLLRDVCRDHPDKLPEELVDLIGFGSAVATRPLWLQQEQALIASLGDSPNLVVATGTGSGKTEIFLLPIFARVLREARAWPAPRGPLANGDRTANGTWRPSRFNEDPVRQPAMRAMVLYPMNALANDQIRRLRRILGSEQSERWQRGCFHGNVIHFGVYTSGTLPTGHWSNDYRLNDWRQARAGYETAWNDMPERERAMGGWPRVGGPEMLCRWDMQHAPPDLLITNYSMLEYMLVRPLEQHMFGLTRQWLRASPDNVFTLVLDEAHTYRGARGTEIAMLIRRLKDRLGLEPDSGQFRCIATSASLPTRAESERAVQEFAALLFGERVASFSVIGPPPIVRRAYPPATARELSAFQTYHETVKNDADLALDALASALGLPTPDRSLDLAVRAFVVFQGQTRIGHLRDMTARNATRLDVVERELWAELGGQAERNAATAGVLAVGSVARPTVDPYAQPLLSSRLHVMFRGVAGIWACMDPGCRDVDQQVRAQRPSRPAGRLYLAPQTRCSCGARVLELFTCRVCGLAFLGGVPQPDGSLWPWSDDLQGNPNDFDNYQIFGVEEPASGANREFRSTRTTLRVTSNDPHARLVFPVQGANVAGRQIPFPHRCPRCSTQRGKGEEGREIVEPLRTKGSKAFSVLVEDSFRLQPILNGESPTGGRKALTFADSRQDAAVLTGDLEIDHRRDVFRQAIYRLLHSCPTCLGYGGSWTEATIFGGEPGQRQWIPCADCDGSGAGPHVSPIAVPELRQRLLLLLHRAKINPTLDEVPSYFADQVPGIDNPHDSTAHQYIEAIIRNEIAAPDFGLEPMGLATWIPQLPAVVGAIHPLSQAETRSLLSAVIRILGMADAILPRTRSHFSWPPHLVPQYDRKLVARRASGISGSHVVYFNFAAGTQLGRYMASVAARLQDSGRVSTASGRWLSSIEEAFWTALTSAPLRVLQPSIDGPGLGIGIDRFRLEPLPGNVKRCRSCGYVMAETVLDVCVRCGQNCDDVPSAGIANFYRRQARWGLPNSGYPDPFPFRVEEHTAQTGRFDSRRYERWFQDLFTRDEQPDDRRIDVLSVTTTMEMGIDIGNLLGVGLRNIPPTVANYQQRAGRAGRRGTALATVVSFALPRSHDQFYFARPQSIISDAPRVPRLNLENPAIVRRHVRAVLLQYFFLEWPPTADGRATGVMSAWGTTGQFAMNKGVGDLTAWLARRRLALEEQVARIVPEPLRRSIAEWIQALPGEVGGILTGGRSGDLLVEMLNAALLPRHAFPIDVVSFWTRHDANPNDRELESGVQRDLTIALSEFAPGAEVVRKKHVFEVVGLYDPYQMHPLYAPTHLFVECRNCRAVQILRLPATAPDLCPVCHSAGLRPMPVLRPSGFCSDWSDPDGQRYRGGGRERAGSVRPARLEVGDDSFQQPISEFSPRLHTRVRVGQLHIINPGPDPHNPGFLICSACGRNLQNPGQHTYPADIPPHQGANRGPRTGTRHDAPSTRSVLWHSFPSEVLLLGIELGGPLAANVLEPSGRACWLSAGTLLANAAAAVLNIDPDELRVGMRAIARGDGQFSGEIYIHDTLPGGAGYARQVHDSLDEVFTLAAELGRSCTGDCRTACYNCLLDYRNQPDHPLLDRTLGHDLIEWVRQGTVPRLGRSAVEASLASLEAYLPPRLILRDGRSINSIAVHALIERDGASPFALVVRHPLLPGPAESTRTDFAVAGYDLRSFTAFDLDRRPFWAAVELAR